MAGDKMYDTLPDCFPYEMLAAAIVRQAIADYHETYQEMMMYKHGGAALERERCNLYLLENWFLGDWCDALTYGNGELLLEMLKRGIEF